MTSWYHGMSLGSESYPIRISSPAQFSHPNMVTSGRNARLETAVQKPMGDVPVGSTLQSFSPFRLQELFLLLVCVWIQILAHEDDAHILQRSKALIGTGFPTRGNNHHWKAWKAIQKPEAGLVPQTCWKHKQECVFSPLSDLPRAPLVHGTICLKRVWKGLRILISLLISWPLPVDVIGINVTVLMESLLKKASLPSWLSLFIQSEATACFSIPDLTTSVFPPMSYQYLHRLQHEWRKTTVYHQWNSGGRFLALFIEKLKLNRKKIESK